jgi:hypothetical protein
MASAASCACPAGCISWQDDNTLKIETDAGEQTRPPAVRPVGLPGGAGERPAGRSLQGTSVAEWQRLAVRSTRSSSAVAVAAASGAGDRSRS